jgi:hypothetical protein
VQQYAVKRVEHKGSAKHIKRERKGHSNEIFTGIIVVLTVLCVTLAVLLIVKRRHQKTKAAVRMSYSTAPLTGGSEGDWQDMRADGEDAQSRVEESNWCGEASNPMPGSEENIYTFLREPDQAFN